MAEVPPAVISAAVALEDLPCADIALLPPLQASAEFAAIAARLGSARLFDSWQEDDLHFFVFPVQPAATAANGQAAEREGPVAVFIMHPASPAPVSAVIVTPGPDGAEPEIQDLRSPERGTVNE